MHRRLVEGADQDRLLDLEYAHEGVPKSGLPADGNVLHDRSVWETVDAEGRRVVLTDERWRHVCDEHRELAPFRNSILATVADPAERTRGRGLYEEWFYGSGFGPSRFVKVVVHYESRVGTIRTAFPRRRFP